MLIREIRVKYFRFLIPFATLRVLGVSAFGLLFRNQRHSIDSRNGGVMVGA